MRNNVPQPEDLPQGQQQIRIQADLPRQLRKELTILYKIAQAASQTEDFKSAHVRDYALVFDGKEYTARQMEQLPIPLRPSSLATRKGENSLIFFTKYCELSNHFPSTFQIGDNKFHNVEQYLALRRAELSQQDLIDKALHLQDPVEAKSILNTLRKDHEEEWQKSRYDIAKTGIKAKFAQNKALALYLCNTQGLHLGEASKDAWGIGMTLEDKRATDITKWNPEGNLLGKILMHTRDELLQNASRPQ